MNRNTPGCGSSILPCDAKHKINLPPPYMVILYDVKFVSMLGLVKGIIFRIAKEESTLKHPTRNP